MRHGESRSNAGGVTMPHAEIPLTDKGRTEAAELVNLLPVRPGKILSSPFLRAVDTAQPYAERVGARVELEPLLCELNMIDPALISGLNHSQRRPITENFWHEADPQMQLGENAESFEYFSGRVRTFRAATLTSLPHNTVCFGHGIWIGMLAWQLLGFSCETSYDMRLFRRFQTGFPLPNGVIYVARELKPGDWALGAAGSV
ncbi:histidine phosphatase family protein [Stenotrophomonas lactitubi]|uniref:histidine phosphatase family protein n=1 Tax=Stenotrophomonas lactitubi TaxID=2045214 RepID=UPI00320A6C27